MIIPTYKRRSAVKRINRSTCAFTLVEVILAIMVISVAVVALLGLFAPTMGSVKKVIDAERANVISGHLRSQVNDHMDFDTLGSRLANGPAIYFYAWDYELMATDASGEVIASEVLMTPLGTAAAPLGTLDDTRAAFSEETATLAGATFMDIADSANWVSLGGMVFVVKFEQIHLGSDPAVNAYNYANYLTEAYVPFLVSIYQVSPEQIAQGLNEVLELTDANLVQSYPFAKLR